MDPKPEPGRPVDLQSISDSLYRNMLAIGGNLMKGERVSHTLTPTALVGAAVERLLEHEQRAFVNRYHLLAVAATTMRRVLVDHARSRARMKRGGDRRAVSWQDVMNAVSTSEDPALVVMVDDAVETLRAEDDRYARILEMRVFGGMTAPEIAQALGVSLSTVEKDWRYVKCRALAILSDDTQ